MIMNHNSLDKTISCRPTLIIKGLDRNSLPSQQTPSPPLHTTALVTVVPVKRPPCKVLSLSRHLLPPPPHFLYFCLFPEMPNDDATFWQDNRQIFLNCWLLPIVFSIPRGKVIFSTGKYLYIGLLELFVRGRDRRGEG